MKNKTNKTMNNYTSQFVSIPGLLTFVNGFANGTTIANTPNYTSCYNAIEAISYRVNITAEAFKNNKTAYGMLLASESFFNIFYHLYDINFACYYGAQEAIVNVVSLGGSMTNPMVIYTNIIYNFGLAYNAIKNMILYFLGAPRPGDDTPYSVGYNLGSIFFYMLFDS